MTKCYIGNGIYVFPGDNLQYIYSICLIADQQTKVHINRDVQFFNIYSIYLISDQQIKVHTETRKNKTFQKANTDTDRDT